MTALKIIVAITAFAILVMSFRDESFEPWMDFIGVPSIFFVVLLDRLMIKRKAEDEYSLGRDVGLVIWGAIVLYQAGLSLREILG